jgi:hypothetical protein
MGAMKEAFAQAIESVFETSATTIKGEQVFTADLVFDYILAIENGDDEWLRSMEHDHFETYGIDTADFLADWAGKFATAIGIFTGQLTTEDGCAANYFDILAYSYHHTPRSVVKALSAFGLTDSAVQGIIYLLAGRLLDASEQLRIVKFEYLSR